MRTIDSAFFKVHCHEEVVKQLDEKQLRKQQELQEKARFAAQWENDRLTKHAIEDAKQQRRQQAVLDNRRDLKQQMDEQATAAMESRQHEQREKEKFQAILAADAEASRQKSIAENERKRQLQHDIVEYNEQLQHTRNEAARKQREEERRDLQEKMEEYQRDTIRHEKDIGRQKADIREFKEYLERRKEEER